MSSSATAGLSGSSGPASEDRARLTSQRERKRAERMATTLLRKPDHV